MSQFRILDLDTHEPPDLVEMAKEPWWPDLRIEIECLVIDEEGIIYAHDRCGNYVAVPVERGPERRLEIVWTPPKEKP